MSRTTATTARDVQESIAAISHALWTDAPDFCHDHGDYYAGSAGVYAMIISAAEALEAAVAAAGGWDADLYDWYLTCDAVAAYIITELPRTTIPTVTMTTLLVKH